MWRSADAKPSLTHVFSYGRVYYFYCATIAYHVELNAYSAKRPRKMDEIMMVRCLISTVGEPPSEKPHALIFSRWPRYVQSCFLLQGKKCIFYVDMLVVGY